MAGVDRLPEYTVVNDLAATYPKFLVGFFSPSCHYCRVFYPKYIDMVARVEEELGHEIPVFALDSTGYTAVEQSGVPHVDFYSYGQPTHIPDAQNLKVLYAAMREVAREED